MGIASLVVGVFATIVALVATAPFFGFFALAGAPLALGGISLAVGEFLRARFGKPRAPELEHEHLAAAKKGLVTNSLALFWCVGLFVAVKAFI